MDSPKPTLEYRPRAAMSPLRRIVFGGTITFCVSHFVLIFLIAIFVGLAGPGLTDFEFFFDYIFLVVPTVFASVYFSAAIQVARNDSRWTYPLWINSILSATATISLMGIFILQTWHQHLIAPFVQWGICATLTIFAGLEIFWTKYVAALRREERTLHESQ